MLTDRQKQLIESYIPSHRDESLDRDEYYVLYSGRSKEYIRKVRICTFLPHGDSIEYGVRDVKSNAWVDAGYGTPFRGWRMAALYDNKEDCKNQTHCMYANWEDLRKIQQEGE